MRGRSVVILLGLVVAAVAGSTSAQVPSLGTYHALVIGNQAYKNLRPLQTPVADATAVADLLRRDYGFATGAFRGLRGGSWNSFVSLPAWGRSAGTPIMQHMQIGFRCAKSAQ